MRSAVVSLVSLALLGVTTSAPSPQAKSVSLQAYFRESFSPFVVTSIADPQLRKVDLIFNGCTAPAPATYAIVCSSSPQSTVALEWTKPVSDLALGQCSQQRLKARLIVLPTAATINPETSAVVAGDKTLVAPVEATLTCKLQESSNGATVDVAGFSLKAAVVPSRVPIFSGAISLLRNGAVLRSSWSTDDHSDIPYHSLASLNGTLLDSYVRNALTRFGLPSSAADASRFDFQTPGSHVMVLLSMCAFCKFPQTQAMCVSAGQAANVKTLRHGCGFDGSTRVFIGGIEAERIHLAADGSYLAVDVPSYSALCPSLTRSKRPSSSAPALCGMKAITLVNREGGSDPSLAMKSAENDGGLANGLFAAEAAYNSSLLQGWALNKTATRGNAVNLVNSTMAAINIPSSPAGHVLVPIRGGKVVCPGFCPGQAATQDAFPLSLRHGVLQDSDSSSSSSGTSAKITAVRWDAASNSLQSADREAFIGSAKTFAAGTASAYASGSSSSGPQALSKTVTSGSVGQSTSAAVAARTGVSPVKNCYAEGWPDLPFRICANASDPLSAQCPYYNPISLECQRCPANAVCPNGMSWPLPGYFAANPYQSKMEVCPPPSKSRCTGWNATLRMTTCGEGYAQGTTLCKGCAAGYYSAYSGGPCRACPPGTGAWAIIRPILIAVVCIIAFVALIFGIMHGLARWRGGVVKGGFMRAISLFYWSITVLQIVSEVGRQVTNAIPSWLGNYFSDLTIFQFNGIAVPSECAVSGHPFSSDIAIFTIGLLLTLFCMLAPFALWLVMKKCAPSLLPQTDPEYEAPYWTIAPASNSSAPSSTADASPVVVPGQQPPAAPVKKPKRPLSTTLGIFVARSFRMLNRWASVGLIILYPMITNSAFSMVRCSMTNSNAVSALYLNGASVSQVLDASNEELARLSSGSGVAADDDDPAGNSGELSNENLQLNLLLSNPSYVCYSGNHGPVVTLAWVTIFVSLLLFPLMIFLLTGPRLVTLTLTSRGADAWRVASSREKKEFKQGSWRYKLWIICCSRRMHPYLPKGFVGSPEHTEMLQKFALLEAAARAGNLSPTGIFSPNSSKNVELVAFPAGGSSVAAAAVGGGTPVPAHLPTIKARKAGCCGGAKKKGCCAITDDVVQIEEFAVEAEAIRHWRARKEAAKGGKPQGNGSSSSVAASAPPAPQQVRATVIYDAESNTVGYSGLHQRSARVSTAAADFMTADSLPSAKPTSMAPVQTSTGSTDSRLAPSKASALSFYRAGGAASESVTTTAKPSIVAVSPAGKDGVPGRRGSKKGKKGMKRPPSLIFDVSRPKEELWHPRPEWRSNDVVDTCPQVLNDLYLGPYIISIRPTGFWYRHVDHVIILLLSAINNFWPSPQTVGEVAGRTIAQVAISLIFFAWIATRDPFTATLRYKYWVKLYSLLLVAFVAITSGVSYSAGLEVNTTESQAATGMAIVSFIGTVVLMVMLAVAFVISVFRPDTAEEVAADDLAQEMDPLASPLPNASRAYPALPASGRKNESAEGDEDNHEQLVNEEQAPAPEDTARSEAVVVAAPSVSGSPVPLVVEEGKVATAFL